MEARYCKDSAIIALWNDLHIWGGGVVSLSYGSMAGSKLIPSLDEMRDISTAQRDEFRDNGHILVRSLLSGAEVAVYRHLIVEAVKIGRASCRERV